MRVWHGYGSEHSMNLVMIGRFNETRDAKKAREVIEKFVEQVRAEPDHYERSERPEDHRYTEAMLKLMESTKTNSIGPTELEQFLYDVRVEVNGSEVVITTDEIEVSAFLKILVDHGARVEVYSAHDHPDAGHGRGG